MQHVGNFTIASGAEINRAKSLGAWLGGWATTPKLFAGIGWTTSVGNYLGVSIDPQGPSSTVWKKAANSIASKLSPWQCRYLSFFNRAYVCNAVIYPAVLYKAQAVCCPGATARRIHRSWAIFVCKSSMERTRRENLFLHQEGGGLGLVNIVLKLHVQRFLLFRDAKDPVFLSALHHLGFPHLGRGMVTTSGRTTKAAALRFYSEIAASIEFFLARFSWDYLATAGKRKLYWDTISVTFPPPLYRPPPVPDGTAGLLKLVRRLPVSAASKYFFVHMHLEVLPVKAWMHRRGSFVPWSLNCDLCGATETTQHVLVECSNAYLFWDEMRTIFNLRTAFDVEWVNLKYQALGGRETAEVTYVLVLLGLHAIWQSRTAMVQCHIDAGPTWDYFVAKLDWVISLTDRGTSTATDQWRCVERQLEAGGHRRGHRPQRGGVWLLPRESQCGEAE
ncbi:unnamed protein product [Ixodes hexagonus]